MDPAEATSIAHTLFLAAQCKSAIEIYGGRAAHYLNAAAWTALCDEQRVMPVEDAKGEKQIDVAEFSATLQRVLSEPH